MQSLIEQLNNLFQQNQVLSTVAGGSVIVWLVSNIKMIWNKFVWAVTSLISFQIVNIYEDNRGGGGGWSVTDAQCAFNEFVCSTKPIWERTKNLDLSRGNYCMEDDVKVGKDISDLAYGFSIRLMFGKVVICNRSIEKSQKITVTTVLRVFFASKEKFMRELSSHLMKELEKKVADEKTRDYIKVYNGETAYGEKFKRSMDSIFTNNGEHYKLLESIQSFIENKDKYRKLAYPYSYSALLYGAPGCGKSSTILAIASALNKDITYVNLAKITMEKMLQRLNCSRGDIVVFEDIDALTTPVGTSRDAEKRGCVVAREEREVPKGAGREDCEKDDDTLPGTLNLFSSLSGVSLSEILNFTDGLLASDGTICLFTTNHIERLDPALLRAGRMNELVEFTNLNAETASRMIKANLGIEIATADLKDGINPAQLQADILHAELGEVDFEAALRKHLKSAQN